MKILIAEDELIIRDGVREFLEDQGYQVIEAGDGQQALELFQKHSIDLAILDIMLPNLSGIKLLQAIRSKSQIPIIMLTALTDEMTQLKSFDEQADDYITKPFSLMVLKKRIEALIRRSQAVPETWSYGQASVDFKGYEATYQGRRVDIKPKEIQLLRALLEHQGQALTRGQLIDWLWSEGDEIPFERVIDVYIKNLRKKLKLDCITTVKNVGYKIEL